MLLKSFLAIATLLSINTAFAAEAAIPYQEAPKFYNQTKTVEGTIVGTHCNDKMCFLNFDKDYSKYLSAVIMSSDFAKFTKATGKDLQTEIDKMYAGKKVQITGSVNEYKSKDASKPGRPQIAVTDSTKIKVLTK
jgi:hypothetical protein